MNIFSSNDIFDYIIDNIHMLNFHVLDYKKLKNVSVSFNKKFNPQLLFIETKKYNELMSIGGITYKHILNIIEKNILDKYDLNKKKFILDRIIHNSKLHLHLLIINSKLCIYIEYFIEILYICSYKKHRNAMTILDNISQKNSIFKYSDINDILNIVAIYLDLFNYIKRMAPSNRLKNWSVYSVNISIVVFILIKGIYNIIKNSSNNDSPNNFKLNKLFILQNQKLNEYKEDFVNENSSLHKTYPKYYLKYVMNLFNELYINM